MKKINNIIFFMSFIIFFYLQSNIINSRDEKNNHYSVLKTINEDVFIIGDIHGTKEIAFTFSELIRSAVINKEKPIVIIELPKTNTEYLCNIDNMNILYKKDMYWRNGFKDGRTSVAMHDMVCSFLYNKNNKRLKLLFLESFSNDEKLLEEIIKQKEDGYGPVYILIGNNHARVGKEEQSLATVLEDSGMKILSLTVTAVSGSAWVCTSSSRSSCGVQKLEMNFCGLEADDRRPVVLQRAEIRRTRAFPWDGCFNIVKATPSMPKFPE